MSIAIVLILLATIISQIFVLSVLLESTKKNERETKALRRRFNQDD